MHEGPALQELQPDLLGRFRDEPEAFERAAAYLRWPPAMDLRPVAPPCPECLGHGRHRLGKGWVQCGWCQGFGLVRREDLSR
jgi:hypothetical protein